MALEVVRDSNGDPKIIHRDMTIGGVETGISVGSGLNTPGRIPRSTIIDKLPFSAPTHIAEISGADAVSRPGTVQAVVEPSPLKVGIISRLSAIASSLMS